MPHNYTPSRPDTWTLADDGLERAEMMDYYNQPYIGIRRIKKRLTVLELWDAFKQMVAANEKWKRDNGVYNVPSPVASAWMEREGLKVEVEEGRI